MRARVVVIYLDLARVVVMVRGRVNFFTLDGLTGGQGLWRVTKLREAVAVLKGHSGSVTVTINQVLQACISTYAEPAVTIETG